MFPKTIKLDFKIIVWENLPNWLFYKATVGTIRGIIFDSSFQYFIIYLDWILWVSNLNILEN